MTDTANNYEWLGDDELTGEKDEIARDKAASVGEHLEVSTSPAPEATAEPQVISGLSLFFAAFGNWLKTLFKK